MLNRSLSACTQEWELPAAELKHRQHHMLFLILMQNIMSVSSSHLNSEKSGELRIPMGRKEGVSGHPMHGIPQQPLLSGLNSKGNHEPERCIDSARGPSRGFLPSPPVRPSLAFANHLRCPGPRSRPRKGVGIKSDPALPSADCR